MYNKYSLIERMTSIPEGQFTTCLIENYKSQSSVTNMSEHQSIKYLFSEFTFYKIDINNLNHHPISFTILNLFYLY